MLRFSTLILVLLAFIMLTNADAVERRGPEKEGRSAITHRFNTGPALQRAESENKQARRKLILTTRRGDPAPSVRIRRRGIDKRDFFVTWPPRHIPKIAVEKSILEQVLDQLNTLWSQLAPAFIFFLALAGCRFFYANDNEIQKRAKGPQRALLVYFWLALLVVFSGMYWTSIHRLLHLVSLFVLMFGIVQGLAVMLVDGFLARTRRIQIPQIVRDVGIIFLYVVASIIVLSAHGVDLTGILTGSVVLTAVVGLAFQDTLGSIASGLALQIERPYQEGDWVNFEGRMGRVLEINWRSTQLHTLENEIIVVPNKLLTAVQVTNMSRPQRWHRRFIKVGLPYGAAPNHCKQILESAARTSGVINNPPPFATMLAFDDHAITYQLFFYITQIERFETIEDQVRTNVWYQLKRAGLSVPFPIRDITVHQATEDKEEVRRKEVLAARVKALTQIPFLAPLDEYEREELAARMREDQYGGSETIVNQGERDDCLFFIQEGEVEVLVSGPTSTRPRRMALLGRGDFFGEMSLMTGERSSATVRTLTDALFFVVDHNAFREVLADHPEICTQIAAILEERSNSMESKHLEFASNELMPVSSEEAENLLDRIRSFFGV